MVFVETLLSLNREFFHFWGYVIVFLALFIESLPFIGAVIPGGTIILLLAGVLTRFGFFNLWEVAIVAIVASVAVDTFGYCLGRYVKRDFFHKYARKLFIKQSTLERVAGIVHGHIGKALMFGRLNPVTRSMGPFIVGTERIKFLKFFFFNVIGAILWVVMFIFIGYIFGGSFGGVGEMESFIVWTTLILVGGFYVYYVFSSFRNGKTKCEVNKYGIDCKE